MLEAIVSSLGSVGIGVFSNALSTLLGIGNKEHTVQTAVDRACKEFDKKYREKYGKYYDSFIARESNWNVIYDAIEAHTDLTDTVDLIDPAGFYPFDVRASREDVLTFVRLLEIELLEIEKYRLYKENSFRETVTDYIKEQSRKNALDWDNLRQYHINLTQAPLYGEKNYSLDSSYVSSPGEFRGNAVESTFDFILHYHYRASDVRKILILLGDFGAGKSSTLKVCAARMASVRQDVTPVYIALNTIFSNVSIKESILESIRPILGNIDLADLDRPVLLMLDGFDEMQRFFHDEDKEKEILNQLIQLGNYKNVCIIISSRTTSFLVNSIVNTAAYPILYISDFTPKNIEAWLARWSEINSKGTEISVDALRQRGLLDIAGNKLILYMIAKIYDEELKEKRIYSKAYVYKQFYDWTIKGKFYAESYARPIGDQAYRKILQSIAYVMYAYSGGEEWMEFGKLKEYIYEYQNIEIDPVVFKSDKVLFNRHFFTAKIKDDIEMVEFAHKSFKEYLLAEKLYDFLVNIKNEPNSDSEWFSFGRIKYNEKEPLVFLQELLGELGCEDILPIYLWSFMHSIVFFVSSRPFVNLLKRAKEKNVDLAAEAFIRSISLIMLSGTINNICYNILLDRGESPDPSKRSCDLQIFDYCNYPSSTPTGKEGFLRMFDTYKQFIRHLQIANQKAYWVDFSNLRAEDGSMLGCDILGGNWSASKLSNMTFSNDNLSTVKFHASSLTNSNWIDCSLINCDMSYLRFVTDCKFDHCMFTLVSFNDSIFYSSVFTSTEFSRCTLKRVLFNNCTLNDINFIMSNIEWLDFNDCTLERVAFQLNIEKKIQFKNTTLRNCTFTRMTEKTFEIKDRIINADNPIDICEIL